MGNGLLAGSINLSEADQALFALGYYHQRNKYFAKSDTATEAGAEGDA